MRSSIAFPAAVLALAGCGRGVDNLSLEAAPLAYLHGQVDLAAVAAAAVGKPLRAALVWGAVPNYVLACVKYPANADLQAACPDPFGFVPGQIEADVLVPSDGDGSFTIPLMRLPSASVSVGSDSARIAWASVIVGADSDANGAFDLLVASQDRTQPLVLADAAVAASFFTLQAPQQRLAYREGGWNDLSLFYPVPGCDPPRAGFSILGTPGMVGLDPAPGACTSVGLDRVVQATPLTPAQAQGLACRTLNRASVRQPGDRAPGQGRPGGPPGASPGRQICLDKETLALIGDGACPSISVLPLSGCSNDLVCQTPEWDLRQQPPAWWPCGP